ncbi:hypothetical protein ACNOYE_30560 [Nannocystaceae bacterium ST9]
MMVKNVQRLVDGDAEVVIDTRYLPIVISTWFGTPALGLANMYGEWIHGFFAEQAKLGTRVILVNDATLSGRPGGEVRTRFAGFPTPEFVLDLLIVVTNPAVRGAATAVRWIAGERMKMNFASDLPSALIRALGLLARSGIEIPRALRADRYELPVMPRRRRASRSEARSDITRPESIDVK